MADSHLPSAPPEAGSVDGVHLRDGACRNASALEAPEPYRRGALYSIYPRAFSPEGTLAAIEPRLEGIAALGATAIWLLPVHPVGREGRKGPAGSPYAVRDYRAVDPALGTVDDLRRLAAAAHALGLRVLIDFVANHAANDPVMAAGHPEWFARDAGGRPARRHADWSDVADWRHREPGATGYLVESAAYWVEEVGLDGFRCDVAGMVPGFVWQAVHDRLAAARPDHFMLAEWQDPELHRIAFHASYDWLFYRAMRDVALGKAPAGKVSAALAAWRENFPPAALPLRFLENHDEPRAAALFGPRLPAYAAAAILSGGLPLLYNGQEIGADHRPSLFEAEPIDWSRPPRGLTALYRSLVALQAAGDPWGPGPARTVDTDRPEAVLAFAREGTARRGLVAANLGRERVAVRILDAGAAAGMTRILEGTIAGPGAGGAGHAGEGASGVLTLEPGEAWIGEGPR